MNVSIEPRIFIVDHKKMKNGSLEFEGIWFQRNVWIGRKLSKKSNKKRKEKKRKRKEKKKKEKQKKEH